PIKQTIGEPHAQRIATILYHPGVNVTGLSGFIAELDGKQLGLLNEAFPRLSRVAIISWASFAPNVEWLKDMKIAAEKLGVTLQLLELRGADDVERAHSAVQTEP